MRKLFTLVLFTFFLCTKGWSQAPVNDNCSGAIALSCNSSYSGDNTNATTEVLPASTCDDANNAEIKLIVYPNPATSVVNVQVGGTTTVKVVRLYDALGKQVMLKENSIGTVYSFNVSALASGYYSVVVETSNGKLSKGFTKQ